MVCGLSGLYINCYVLYVHAYAGGRNRPQKAVDVASHHPVITRLYTGMLPLPARS